MRLSFLTVLGTALLLSACQGLPTNEPQSHSVRWQGIASQQGTQWQLQPCGEQPNVLLDFTPTIEKAWLADLPADTPLFMDLAVTANPASATRLSVSTIYRIEHEGFGCADPDLAQLQLRAFGNEPFWSLRQSAQGLLLEQPGQPALALPYIEEQLPNGMHLLSSEADQQDLQLWLTPKRCTDSMSGSVYHLNAELHWQGQTHTGCAYYGAHRNNVTPN